LATNLDKDEVITIKTVITWVLTVGTVLAGVWQFSSQKAQSNRVPFLTEQLKLGFEASDTAARLATETDPAKWEETRQTFLAALLGRARHRRGPRRRGGDGRSRPDRAEGARNPGAAHATARAAIADARPCHPRSDPGSWKIDLPPLQGGRQ
jgi:hypothetical protein